MWRGGGEDVLSWQYPNTMDAVKNPEYDGVRVVDLRPVAGMMISGSAAAAAKIMALSVSPCPLHLVAGRIQTTTK
jgi:hypothetical protein